MKEALARYMEKYEAALIEQADALLTQRMEPLTEELFALFEQNGNRLRYEGVYFGRRKFLAVLGTAAILYRKPEYIKKLEEVIKEVCQEECWALPAHVNRAKNKDWRIVIDLFASETGQTLAEITYHLKDMLSEDILAMAEKEIERRILTPFLKTKVYLDWEESDNNWNAVCAGSVACTAIYMMTDEEAKKQCVSRLIRSVNNYFLKGFSKDGVCMEGLSYWTYGMSYYTMFAEVVNRMKGEFEDMMASEHVRNIALFQQKCYFPYGRTISFSDADRKGMYRIGLTSYLALTFRKEEKGKKVSEIQFPDLKYAEPFGKDHCWRFAGLYRDMVWGKTLLKALQEEELEVHCVGNAKEQIILSDAQWVIHRGANESAFVIKGGNNNEPHNHNDVGSYFYLAGDDEILCDLGCGEYTKDYFSDKRYTIFCNGTESHNVVLVNDAPQAEGKEKCCSLFTCKESGEIEMAYQDAYDEKGLTALVRTAVFDQDTGSLQIRDRIKGEKGIKITQNLVTQLPVSIEDTTIKITGKTYEATITIEGVCENLRKMAVEHSNHEGKMESVTRILWDFSLQQEAESGYKIKLLAL